MRGLDPSLRVQVVDVGADAVYQKSEHTLYLRPAQSWDSAVSAVGRVLPQLDRDSIRRLVRVYLPDARSFDPSSPDGPRLVPAARSVTRVPWPARSRRARLHQWWRVRRGHVATAAIAAGVAAGVTSSGFLVSHAGERLDRLDPAVRALSDAGVADCEVTTEVHVLACMLDDDSEAIATRYSISDGSAQMALYITDSGPILIRRFPTDTAAARWLTHTDGSAINAVRVDDHVVWGADEQLAGLVAGAIG